MFVLLELFHKFFEDRTRKQRGWRKYIIYPFVILLYKVKVMFMLKVYIERINNIIGFRTLLVEYISFLTVITKITYPNTITDINDILRYVDETRIFPIYTDGGKLKSADYFFRYNGYGGNTTIKVNLNEVTNLMIIDLTTDTGTTSFSYNSLIDARLIGVKDSIERIIRRDIAANLEYILYQKKIF